MPDTLETFESVLNSGLADTALGLLELHRPLFFPMELLRLTGLIGLGGRELAAADFRELARESLTGPVRVSMASALVVSSAASDSCPMMLRSASAPVAAAADCALSAAPMAACE